MRVRHLREDGVQRLQRLVCRRGPDYERQVEAEQVRRSLGREPGVPKACSAA